MSQDTEPVEARRQKLASFFNVVDHSELWLQIRALDRLDSVKDAEPVEPVTRTRQRRPSLATALTQAAKAGLTVGGATIAPDGSVTLTFGDGSTTTTNPWDEVLNSCELGAGCPSIAAGTQTATAHGGCASARLASRTYLTGILWSAPLRSKAVSVRYHVRAFVQITGR